MAFEKQNLPILPPKVVEAAPEADEASKKIEHDKVWPRILTESLHEISCQNHYYIIEKLFVDFLDKDHGELKE